MSDLPPGNGIGQSCAWCDAREVTWVHPLDPHLARYRSYGKGHTLPGFWVLCERCEDIYGSGDDDAAVEIMVSSPGWRCDDEDDIAECVRKPLEVLRRADLGGQRLDPAPASVTEARSVGFVPLRELTGVADTLGHLWPPEHRLWLEDLGAAPREDEYDDARDRWVVRSPWPALSVEQTLNALWRWVEAGPDADEQSVRDARTREFLRWTDAEVVAFVSSDT